LRPFYYDDVKVVLICIDISCDDSLANVEDKVSF
jgi:hypothetical protein